MVRAGRCNDVGEGVRRHPLSSGIRSMFRRTRIKLTHCLLYVCSIVIDINVIDRHARARAERVPVGAMMWARACDGTRSLLSGAVSAP